MNKLIKLTKTFLTIQFLIFLTTTQLANANGSVVGSFPKHSYVSYPSSVNKNQTFSITKKVENDTNENWTIKNYQVYSFHDDGESQNAPLFGYNSGTVTSPSNKTYNLSISKTDSKYVVLKSSTPVVIPSGKSATFTVTLNSNSSELTIGDIVTLNVSSSLTSDSGIGIGAGMDPVSVEIIEETPKPVTPPTQPQVSYAPISKVSLPKVFTNNNSKTSDLSNLTVEESKAFSNLVIDIPKVGMIEFTEQVDLSSEDIADKFKKLDEFITIKKGKIGIDESKLSDLNKKAKITMKNVNLVNDEVTIHKNKKPANDEITNLSYKDKTLTFEVLGFSSYEISPDLKITSSEEDIIELEKSTYTITGIVNDLDATITYQLNDKEPQKVEVKENGHFSVEVECKEGKNTVSIIAKSASDATQQEDLTINYSKPEGDLKDENTNSLIFIVAAFVLIVLTVATLVFFFIIKKKKDNKYKKKDNKKDNKNSQ